MGFHAFATHGVISTVGLSCINALVPGPITSYGASFSNEGPGNGTESNLYLAGSMFNGNQSTQPKPETHLKRKPRQET